MHAVTHWVSLEFVIRVSYHQLTYSELAEPILSRDIEIYDSRRNFRHRRRAYISSETYLYDLTRIPH